MKSLRPFFTSTVIALAVLGLCLPAHGLVPSQSPLALELTTSSPQVAVANVYTPADQLAPGLASFAEADLAALGMSGRPAYFDVRSGRWGSLVMSQPLVPGKGKNNRITWGSLGLAEPTDDLGWERAAWGAFRDYLDAHQEQFRIDTSEIHPTVTSHEGGRLIQIYGRRVVDGTPVRGAFVTATLNNGNLVLFGTRNWGDIEAAGPSLSAADAEAVAARHLEGHETERHWKSTQQEIIPMDLGGGLSHRRAWVVHPKVKDDGGNWQAVVDASTGELLLFGDTNHYYDRTITGGVLPMSNDGVAGPNGEPEGTEQGGWPMPFATMHQPLGTSVDSNSAGIIEAVGQTLRSDLSGPYVRIFDHCGPIDEVFSCGDADLGSGSATDCDYLPGRSTTRAGKSAFYEVNRIIEQARGWLPGNTWLEKPLLSVMNIPESCNAFWGGSSINFYQSEGPNFGDCANSGEIAAVFDHEWGHGMDDNDAAPDVSFPGEAPADIYSLVRLNRSCVGRGFFQGDQCSMGNTLDTDTCLNCDGVREADWKARLGGPHDIAWILGPTGCSGAGIPIPTISSGPCNLGTHCEGSVVSEAVWDMIDRDLPCHGVGWEDIPGTLNPVGGGRCVGDVVPTFDRNTVLNMVARLHYLGGGNAVFWYQCDATGVTGGCNADGGYLNFLAVDDDNGDLSDGTPHMEALYAAWDRHQMACNDVGAPTVQDGGCTAPVAAPTNLVASSGAGSVGLSWDAVAGATEYWVYRADGLSACEFGKERIAITAGTSHLDLGLLGGRDYSYTVEAVFGDDSCRSKAATCATVAPSPAFELHGNEETLAFRTGPDNYQILTGDGDDFLDNCETAEFGFTVENASPTVTLSNVRVVDVRSPSHPGDLQVLSALPIALGTLSATCDDPSSFASTTVQFIPHNLAFNDTLTVEVEVRADSVFSPGSDVVLVGTLDIVSTESDFGFVDEITWSFEDDLQGWQLVDGFYQHATPGAPNPPSSVPFPTGSPPSPLGFTASSTLQAGACDRIRSPEFQITPTTTMEVWTYYDIEPGTLPLGDFDRANFGIVDVATDTLNVVEPSVGRVYTASGTGGGCAEGTPGWNGVGSSWLPSQWTSGDLGAAAYDPSARLRLQALYGTDPLLEGLLGFWFDEVTLTDVITQIPDVQADDFCAGIGICTVGTPLQVDDFESGDTTGWSIRRNPQGDLDVTGVAALEAGFGLEVTVDSTGGRNQKHHYVAHQHAPTSDYCFSFLFDPNDIDLPTQRPVRIGGARASNNRRLLDIEMRPSAIGNYEVRLRAWSDDLSSTVDTDFRTIPNGPVLIGGEWSDTASGGVLRLFLDGALATELTGIPDMTRPLTTPGLGNLGSFGNNSLGTMYFDAFVGGGVLP